MTIASGIAKSIAIKKESTWGAPAATTGTGSAKYLRRTSSTLDLNKANYESNEIRTDYQVADSRDGVRSIGGAIDGELSPGSYQELIAAALRKLFVVGGSTTGASITVASSGSFYTITRAAGSYISDGHRVGDVVRLTAGAFVAGNLNKNMQIITLTATVATVLVLNGLTLTAEGPIATASLTCPGKKSYVPATAHTDDSFLVEHWHSDIAQSERFTGVKVNSMEVALPPTGMATIKFGCMGRDLEVGTAQFFVAPTALSSSGVIAAVNGAICIAGVPVALLTGLSFSLDAGMTAEPVVGSNVYPDINEGRVRFSGQMTAFFENATLRDAFKDETEVSIIAAFCTASTAAAEFVTFHLPRVKLRGAGKSDGERGLIQTTPFTGLLGTGANNADATTVVIQDSLAV